MLNQKQTDCRFGGVAFAAGEDLSLKTGYLARLNAGGDLVLPQGAGEITPYVLTQGADQGYLCGAVPLTSAGNCRVKLAGSCEAGDLLVAKGDGRVEAGALGGGALPVGIAEETGIDGQFVLTRPLSVGAKGEAGADGADGEAGPAGAAGAAGADGMDAGVLLVPRSAVTGGSALGAGDVGRVLFFGDVDLACVWSVAPPSSPQFAAVIAKVSGDADPVLTLKIVIRGNYAGQLVTVPAALVVGEPAYDGWIDVFDAGDGAGDWRLGIAFAGIVGSTAVRVRSVAGSVYMGVTEISV